MKTRRRTTPFAVLGLLSVEPMSGYDIRKEAGSSIGYFWSESYGQVYPALRELSAAGLIRRRTASRRGRRERQVYEITARGRDALRRWRAAPPRRTPARNELLLKLFFAEEMAVGPEAEWVQQVLEEESRALGDFRRIRHELERTRRTHPSFRFWLMTLNYGVHRSRGAGSRERRSRIERPHPMTNTSRYPEETRAVGTSPAPAGGGLGPAAAPDRRLIAPLWHTLVVVGILLGIAGYGAHLQAGSHARSQLVEQRGSALPLYLSLIAAEWGLLRFVYAGGLRRTGTRFRDLLGARWAGGKGVARETMIALLAWAAWSAAEAFVRQHLSPDPAKEIATLLPRDIPEIVAWVLLSLTAGFCEEAVFRGYLQKQLLALTGSTFAAVLAQAVVFGVSHGYQGLRNVITITVFGALYGGLAHWRRSLAPGMILHAWTDIFGGVFAARG